MTKKDMGKDVEVVLTFNDTCALEDAAIWIKNLYAKYPAIQNEKSSTTKGKFRDKVVLALKDMKWLNPDGQTLTQEIKTWLEGGSAPGD